MCACFNMYILCISRLFSGIWWSEKYEETSRFSLRKAPRRPTKPNSAVASLDANVMWVVAHLHGVELVGILKTSCRWIGTMAWYRIYLYNLQLYIYMISIGTLFGYTGTISHQNQELLGNKRLTQAVTGLKGGPTMSTESHVLNMSSHQPTN